MINITKVGDPSPCYIPDADEVNPPPPLDAMQVASLFTAHTPDADDQERTIQQIAADVKWLRAEMVCVESAIEGLSKSLARLVDTLEELADVEPDEDEPALTLDGDDAGSPRDQDEPL